MSRIFLQGILYVFVFVCFATTLAQAQTIRTGGLTCNTGLRVGLVVGSRQNLQCVFRSSVSGEQYTYTGKIRRLGLDLGVTGRGRLFWAVFASTARVSRSTLMGNYVGASANVALGLGLGANVLVGGSHRTIALQPLSVEGQLGVNLALGVANLSLR